MANGVFSVDVTTRSYTAQAGYTAYLYWTETSTGINGTTPYSVVTVTMKMKRLYSWAAAYNSGTGFAYTFKIDGTTSETGNIQYNTQNWTVGTEYTLWSKSVTINHGSDGSKTAALSFAVTDTVLSNFTISGNAVLTNIPMGSTVALSASSVSLSTSASITANITRYSTSYYHKLVWKIGTTTVSTINAGKVASYEYTLTAADWLTKMTNASSASCSVTLTTYSNSNYTTQIGAASTATFTLKCTANPTVTLTSAPRGTAYNKGLTSYYYSGYSTALLTASGSGVSGSTISKYEFYQDSSLIQSGSSATKTTGVLSGTNDIKFKVVVTDSRGRTGSKTVTVTPIAYSAPSLTVNNCYRCTSNGTSSSSGTYLRVKATATANATGNSITSLVVSTATAGGSTIQLNVDLTSGTATTLGSGQYVTTTAFNVTFKATDKMGNSVTVVKKIAATVIPAINVKYEGAGVAFGKYAEDSNVVDSAWKIRVFNNAFEVRSDSSTKLSLHDSNDDLLGAFSYASDRYRFSEYSRNSATDRLLSNYELYRLPRVDDDRTSNATYDILTTKTISIAAEENYTALAANAVRTYTFESGSRGFFWFNGASSTGAQGFYLFNITTQGGVTVREITAASFVTVTTASNQIIFTKSSLNTAVYPSFLLTNGSITSVVTS